MVPPRYSAALTAASPTYCRQNTCHILLFYYQAIQITVATIGTYTIVSDSAFDTFGYIYNNSFNSSFPNLNLLSVNDDGGDANQFMLIVDLQPITKYILVVTTSYANVIGAFSIIIAIGPGPVIFIGG